MINYNKTINDIPMFKGKNSNGEFVDVVSGIFLAKYLGKISADVKIKTMPEDKNFYKINDDYLINFELDKYKELGLYKRPNDGSYDVMLTKDGANKYMDSLKNKKELELKIKNVNRAFDNIYKYRNGSVKLFELIRKGKFSIEFVVDLINLVITEFDKYDLYEIIDGRFKVKADIVDRKIKGTSVPEMISYIDNDALEYTLMELFKEEMITKNELLFLMRKIIAKQVSMESCA